MQLDALLDFYSWLFTTSFVLLAAARISGSISHAFYWLLLRCSLLLRAFAALTLNDVSIYIYNIYRYVVESKRGILL